MLVEQGKIDVFVPTANGFARSRFEQTADSYQDTFGKAQDTLMDLWVAELRATSEW